MRDNVLLFDEIETFGNDRVVLVFVLADLEQDFDHVLDPLVDPTLVQDGAESIENPVVCAGRVLREEGADFAHERDGNLDRVVGGAFKEEHEHLKCEDFVRDLLIYELTNERRSRDNSRLDRHHYERQLDRLSITTDPGARGNVPCCFACNSEGIGG